MDFLIQYYFLLTHSVETLAAFTGLILYKKYKYTSVKYFIWFLIIICLCEHFGLYVRYVRPDRSLHFLIGTKFQKNHWWYNLFWSIGGIMFYAFYYHKILKTRYFKLIIKHSSYCFLIFCIIYYLIRFEEFFHTFFPVIDILGGIVIFLCVVLYFIEILQSERILYFHKSINFYINATIFMWWLVITPLVFYEIYHTYEMDGNRNDASFWNIRSYIYLFSNLFMYLTFTFALIFCKPEHDLISD
ncbi:hypothetical protein MBM09_08520 [Flaviramulus sp. BrNp1-15]|uniref:hypothetical protein n=1 Tax=Flaviramulus sp. BrNp1-15 TaxID=2916754 RepID=UPI001EE90CD3|nr:hypothetical protein [Flaviramulus sp. BrNp1-15]ULC57962.1 hypothetical protein MBM09_08520 [Flaviramulus sp. BrNp1-15]